MASKSEENAKVIIDGFINTILNKQQFDRKLEFVHPDFVNHPHDGQPDANLEAYLAGYQGLLSQFPEIQCNVKKSIASDDHVWLWLSIGGLPEGFDLDIVEICRLQDGKLIEKWDVHQQKTG